MEQELEKVEETKQVEETKFMSEGDDSVIKVDLNKPLTENQKTEEEIVTFVKQTYNDVLKGRVNKLDLVKENQDNLD